MKGNKAKIEEIINYCFPTTEDVYEHRMWLRKSLEELAEDVHHARLMAAHGATDGVRSAARAVIQQIENQSNEKETN